MPRNNKRRIYPWKKYSEFGPVPDFVDQHARVYMYASQAVLDSFKVQNEGDLVFEMKIPIRRRVFVTHEQQNFPQTGDRLTLTPYGTRNTTRPVWVREIYFAPRGATGVCIVRT
jgi:hypothetical protein